MKQIESDIKVLIIGILIACILPWLFILFFMVPSADALDLNQQDKQIHLTGSAVISCAIEEVFKDEPFLKRKAIAVIGTNICGGIKELISHAFDSSNKPDKKDMKANAIGSVLNFKIEIKTNFLGG